MSAVSLPVCRASGNAVLIANAASREHPRSILEGLGYTCVEFDDPYSAATELFRQPGVYRAVIVSLSSVYPEELSLIATLRRRSAQLEVWLTHTDGRHGALAQAMRLGADGLLAEDGLHRLGIAPAAPTVDPAPIVAVSMSSSRNEERSSQDDYDFSAGEPVLTAEELRMLLQEQPSLPPGSDE